MMKQLKIKKRVKNNAIFHINSIIIPPINQYPIPTDGWLQWVFEFPNKVTCEAFLEQEGEALVAHVHTQFIKVPHEIKDVQCLTDKEAVDLNKELGHVTPWKRVPSDKNRLLPKGA